MRFKRLVCFLLMAVMLLSLFACSKTEEAPPEEEPAADTEVIDMDPEQHKDEISEIKERHACDHGRNAGPDRDFAPFNGGAVLSHG